MKNSGGLNLFEIEFTLANRSKLTVPVSVALTPLFQIAWANKMQKA